MLKIGRYKIRLFDLVFALLAGASLLFVYLYFKRELKYIEVRVRLADEHAVYYERFVTNEFANGILVGDKLYDEFGRKQAEVLGVESFFVDMKYQIVYVDLKLRALYDPRKKHYVFNGKPVNFGEAHTFKLSAASFEGVVVEYPGYKENHKVEKMKQMVKVQLRNPSRQFSDIYGVPKFIADNLEEGKKYKTSTGEVLVEIKKIEKKPAKRTVVTSGGNLSVVADPELIDVWMDVEVLTKRIDGFDYLFGYFPLKVGQSVAWMFDDVLVWPTIIEILDE